EGVKSLERLSSHDRLQENHKGGNPGRRFRNENASSDEGPSKRDAACCREADDTVRRGRSCRGRNRNYHFGGAKKQICHPGALWPGPRTGISVGETASV